MSISPEASGRLWPVEVDNKLAGPYKCYEKLLLIWPSVHIAMDYALRQMEVSIRIDICSLLPARARLKPESPSHDVAEYLSVSMVVPSRGNIAGHFGANKYARSELKAISRRMPGVDGASFSSVLPIASILSINDLRRVACQHLTRIRSATALSAGGGYGY